MPAAVCTTKSVVSLKIWPVGAPPGMATVSPALVTGAPPTPPG